MDTFWLLGFEPADIDKPPSFSGVYVLRSATGECLYIGQSVSIFGRLREHRRSKKWWQDVTSLQVLEIQDAHRRLVIETLLVLLQSPCHNRAIKLGRRADGTWHEMQFLRFRKSGKKDGQKQG